MKLIIDACNNLQTKIYLDNQLFTQVYSSPREQNIFMAIFAALDQKKLQLKDISQIRLITGPGSFTGLRLSSAIANALSFSLVIPINQKHPGSIVLPHYGKPPHISIPKKPTYNHLDTK